MLVVWIVLGVLVWGAVMTPWVLALLPAEGVRARFRWRAAIEPYPRVRVAHLISYRRGAPGLMVAVWRLQPIDARRPGTGTRTGELTCAVCGEPVPYVLRDAAGTRRRRAMWLTIALTCTAAFVAFVVWGIVTWNDDDGPRILTTVGGGMATLLAAGFATDAWWLEDGVSLRRQLRPNLWLFAHRLRNDP